MSAVKPVGSVVTAAGVGMWISLAGWPVAAVLGAAVSAASCAVIALVWSVLGSSDRTSRALQIIAALRYRSRDPSRPAAPDQ